MFDTEPGKPIPVLDHDHRSGRVSQDPVQLAPLAVEPGADLLDDLTDSETLRVRAFHNPHGLTVQVIFLLGAGDATRPSMLAGSVTIHVPEGAWRTGTGILPSFTHRQAV